MIGVDKTGNTVYDSVFTVKAPYFENRKFNIMSENLTATMLLPSNDVVNQALSTARKIWLIGIWYAQTASWRIGCSKLLF